MDGARPARGTMQVRAGGELLVSPRTADIDGAFARASKGYGGEGKIKMLF